MKTFRITFLWEGWKIQTEDVKAKDIKTAKEKIRKRWGQKRVTGLKLERVF